jgi:hypothetical protein
MEWIETHYLLGSEVWFRSREIEMGMWTCAVVCSRLAAPGTVRLRTSDIRPSVLSECICDWAVLLDLFYTLGLRSLSTVETAEMPYV